MARDYYTVTKRTKRLRLNPTKEELSSSDDSIILLNPFTKVPIMEDSFLERLNPLETKHAINLLYDKGEELLE